MDRKLIDKINSKQSPLPAPQTWGLATQLLYVVCHWQIAFIRVLGQLVNQNN